MNEFFISVSMEIGVILDGALASDIVEAGGIARAVRRLNAIGCIMWGVATFTAKRTYRPRVMWVGLACVLLGMAATVALGATGHGEGSLRWIGGAGVGAYLLSLVIAMIPQTLTLEAERGRVAVGKRVVRAADVELGPWVLAGVDSAMGLVAHVRGEGGLLRIGGHGEAGIGYALTAAPSRTVDVQVTDFARLLDALGVVRGAPGPLVVPLMPTSYSLRGVLRMMWPWLLTMTAAGLFSVGLSSIGLLESAPMVASGLASVIVVVGLVVTITRSMRVRVPQLELRVAADGLALVRRGVDVARAPWSEVRAVPLRYKMTSRGGSWWFPMLDVVIGSAKPVRIGAWDSTHIWGEAIPRARRGMRWIVGSPQWPLLVGELTRRGRLSH